MNDSYDTSWFVVDASSEVTMTSDDRTKLLCPASQCSVVAVLFWGCFNCPLFVRIRHLVARVLFAESTCLPGCLLTLRLSGYSSSLSRRAPPLLLPILRREEQSEVFHDRTRTAQTIYLYHIERCIVPLETESPQLLVFGLSLLFYTFFQSGSDRFIKNFIYYKAQ